MEQDFKKQNDSITIALLGTDLSVKSKLEQHYFNQSNIILITDFLESTSYDLIFLTTIYNQENPIIAEKILNQNYPFVTLLEDKSQHVEQIQFAINQFKLAILLGFNATDFVSIYKYKIDLNTVAFQFNCIKNGIPKINLERCATLNDGILPITQQEAQFFANFFDSKKQNYKLKKFVPASGAASRMFKFLNEFLNEFKLGEESINAYINRKRDKNLPVFLVAKEKFPFYKKVLKTTQKEISSYETLDKDTQDYWFIKVMLSLSYFDFANKPKAILPFHKYQNTVKTAIEEHLNECVFYATTNQKSNLHFTISQEHQSSFETIIESVKTNYESASNVEINVSYSYQNPSTDVIALNENGDPFREENHKILFRPGGHGALIENLNNLHSDIIFIKNIDNVIQNHIEVITLYKKALAGILIQYQEEIFKFLKILSSDSILNTQINEIKNYIETKLNIEIKDDFNKFTKSSQIEHLFTILNRPIRVCGMVKNEGEPGGGPFWVIDKKGKTFLQIIESSQIDTKDQNQKEIFESGTHFNPVDLVCGIKDHKGQKFDLLQFIDKNAGFVVEKNKNGKPYKAFELPGLWNGAMAKWTTVFVEVPLITFNPVKTVNDLLKPAHQSI